MKWVAPIGWMGPRVLLANRPWISSIAIVLVLLTMISGCEKRSQVPSDEIAQIYPSLPGGRVWTSNWDDGSLRHLRSGQRDPYSPLLIARGNGTVTIDGAGTATVSGISPRIYVYDESQELKWGDVEVTVYGMRRGETSSVGSQGLVIGGRSEHQNASSDVCAGQTYYGRLLLDGRVGFQKELVHDHLYSSSRPANSFADWSQFGGTFPRDVWIGLKFVIRNNSSEAVSLELYTDITGGDQGGDWKLVAKYVDDGQWTADLSESATLLGCHDVLEVFADPATSIFLRADYVEAMSFRSFSIREIEPESSGSP